MEKNATIIKPTIATIIKEVHESGKLVPDLMRCENGNNFRAISEKAILDVLDPILEKYNFFYTVEIKDSRLEIREAYGAKGKKLQFIATVTIRLIIGTNEFNSTWIESVGMGIDDNDKAMGKAYTYAVKYGLLKLFRLRYGDDPDYEASFPIAIKYALLKLFRLRYGDDSDFEASTPLITEYRGEKKEAESKKPEKKDSKNTKTGNALMTESQRDYILGLMKDKNVDAAQIIEEFDVNPVKDKEIPMKTAREIIDWLKNDEYMPF